MILCSRCRVSLPAASFHRKGLAGRQTYCKKCQAEYQRVRLATDAGRKARPSQNRWYKYGMTDDDFTTRFRAQGDSCAVCGGVEPRGRGSWHIDHDHACCPSSYSCGNCVRGILCVNCNVGLAMFGDSTETLDKAVAYLEKYGKIATSTREIESDND